MPAHKDAQVLRHIAREEPLDATLQAFPELTREKLARLLERVALQCEGADLPNGERKAALHRVRVYSDGAARGNPGPSGAGAVLVEPSGQVVDRLGKYLGVQTNNYAEYMGLLLGLKRARELGATEVVTYDELESLDQVDTVFDLVGGDVFARSLSLLNPLGSAIAVGYAGGLWQDVSPTWLVGRNIGVQGFYLGRLMGRRPDLVEQAAKDVLRLWEGGVVRPIVGSEHPLEEAGEAHRLIEERKTTGKVVLVP